MRSIRNRSLITLLILLGSISVVHAQSQSTISASSGWTFVQDSPVIFCAGNVSSCSNFSGTITPTVAGSVWILEVQVPTHGVTITNVTGGGGTWIHCPKCHVDNPNGFDADAWYNLGGNAGTAGGISFTLSGNSGAFISVNFVELLPPAGTTAFYDDSGTAIRSGCSGKSSTPCLAVGGLNITATDVVWQNPGGAGQAAWNSWSSPYLTDYNGGAVALDVGPGSSIAPTVTFSPCGSTSSPAACNPEFMAIAFRSSAGTFSVRPRSYSLVNVAAPFAGAPPSCGACTRTIPTTGAGHLLFLTAADESGSRITSVTDNAGDTWVVPSGSNTCQVQATLMSENTFSSCAYVLSSKAGATSVTVNMSGAASTAIVVFEVASTTGGTFSLDVQGSKVVAAGALFSSGEALTLNGQDDVEFQFSWIVGGSLGPNFYAQPYLGGYAGNSSDYFFLNQAATVVLLDATPSRPNLTWINANSANGMSFSAVAFRAAGGSTSPPNSPTGLTVTVQ